MGLWYNRSWGLKCSNSLFFSRHEAKLLTVLYAAAIIVWLSLTFWILLPRRSVVEALIRFLSASLWLLKRSDATRFAKLWLVCYWFLLEDDFFMYACCFANRFFMLTEGLGWESILRRGGVKLFSSWASVTKCFSNFAFLLKPLDVNKLLPLNCYLIINL